jgi:CubicO group peptidase (beta-lactamase class C family)
MNRQWLTYLKGLFSSGGRRALAEADSLLLQLTDDGKVPGLVASVQFNGQLLLQKGYGYADLESRRPPNPAKTLFRIASISKPIAATALLYIVEEGLIDLDASFYEDDPLLFKVKGHK